MTKGKLELILLSDKPGVLVKENENEIFKIIPALKKCKGFNQNNPWHIYDVYEHILHVLDGVKCVLELRYAALFHDVGKPYVYTEDDNHIGHFYNHYKKSKEIFENYLNKYLLDKKMSNNISKLIYYHDINIDKLTDKELIDMINDLGISNISNLFELKKSDLLAQAAKYHNLLDNYLVQEERIKLLIKEKD